MKLGTSVRFLFPTDPHTYEQFNSALATLPPGARPAWTGCRWATTMR